MKPRLAVVIPALNEEATLSNVLENVLLRGHVPIVVDDGSTDSTVKIANEKAGVVLIQHKINVGYEGALSSGVHYASEQGFELVATFDADNQLDPDDLNRFIGLLDQESSDVVIGIRSYRNRYSEHLVALYGRIRFGVIDPLCGLKLYRVSSAKKFLPFDSQKLVGMELALKMINAGCKFSQSPILIKKRIGDSRYGTSFKGEINILKSLYKLLTKFDFSGSNIK